MNGIEYELQVAILNALKADERLIASGVPSYDVIPDDAVFPYISIDDITAIPYRSKTFNGLEVTAQLSILSERAGQAEVKKLLAYVRAVLSVPLVLREGHLIDYQDLDTERVLEIQDEDVVVPSVKHGVLIYRFKIKEGGL